MAEAIRDCPLGGIQTHEAAFKGRAVISDLGMSDQNLASLCHFYRRIGVCTAVEVLYLVSDTESAVSILPEEIEQG